MQERDEKEVWERITALESSYKSEHKRLDRLEEVIDIMQKQVNTSESIIVEIKHIREDLNGVAEKVNEIEDKPQKRLETFLAAAISALASGVIGFIVAKLIGG